MITSIVQQAYGQGFVSHSRAVSDVFGSTVYVALQQFVTALALLGTGRYAALSAAQQAFFQCIWPICDHLQSASCPQ